MARETLEFVKAALRNPMEVSTVFPTSRFLAQRLLENGGAAHALRVVELGTGTGAITKYLAPILTDTKSYLGVELDAKMVEFMRSEFPTLHFEAGLAENLPEWVEPGTVDVIVSSLPWTVFSEDTQERTVNAIHQALKPGGSFVTYMCVNALWYPLAATFRKRLRDTFAQVQRSDLEWRNVPPAYVFRAIK